MRAPRMLAAVAIAAATMSVHFVLQTASGNWSVITGNLADLKSSSTDATPNAMRRDGLFVDTVIGTLPAPNPDRAENVTAIDATEPQLLHKENPCGVVLRNVTIANDGMSVFGYGRRPVAVPLCTTTSIKHTVIPLPTSNSTPSPCQPVAFVTSFQRPQHAMQFLFSLVASYALLSDAGLDPATTPFYFSIMRYAGVQEWSDIGAKFKRFPHLELINAVTSHPRRMAQNSTPGSVVAVPEGEQVVPQCFDVVVSGVVPLPIPNARERKRNARMKKVTVEHFDKFRAQIAKYYGLALDRHAEPYALLVLREAPGRHIVNWEHLKTGLEQQTKIPFRVVRWEGMPIAEQLKIVVNARAMVGAHGNGLVWACLMQPKAFLIELTSDIRDRNEVVPGINRENAGNIAHWCGRRSLSLVVNAIHTNLSATIRRRMWKNVDLEVTKDTTRSIKSFLATMGFK